MDVVANAVSEESYREPGSLRLMPGRRELALIVAFWTAYALLTLANRLFDPGGGPPGSIGIRSLIAGVESFCWAVLTPFLFWFAGRVDLENSSPGRRQIGDLLSLALVALLTALLLGWLGVMLRTRLAPIPDAVVGLGRDGPPPPGGARIWFGFLNTLIIALGVVAWGVARAYSLRLRARREQAIHLTTLLAVARLDALRRQLDPHFLFNTLNAISSLVERDPRGVRRMIARLGDLLRHSFESGREPEVTLRRELALLGLYVDIVQVRFQDRLTVEVAMEHDVLDALVPSLILQPLVENAIKHGVEQQTDGGRIIVEGLRSGDTLILRVRDDAEPSDVVELTHEPNGAGVGLRNTRARLEQLYGSAQHFALVRDARRRAVAEVRLPFHLKPEARHVD